jgi:hypothetical protein
MWTLTIDVLLLSMPFIASGVWATLAVATETRRLFRIDMIHLGLGLFGLVPNLFVLFLLRQNVESAYSYTMIFHEGLTATGSLAVTVVAASIWGGITASFMALYVSGVVSEGTGKYDKRPGELDGVGALLEELSHAKVARS